MRTRRFDPYANIHGAPANRGFQRLPRGPGNAARRDAQENTGYNWERFQREETVGSTSLYPTQIPPPKLIQTVRFENPPTPAPEKSSRSQGTYNICASWLAKNKSIIRQKEVQAITVTDERSDENVLDQTFSLNISADVAEVTTEVGCDDDEDIIVLQERIGSPAVSEDSDSEPTTSQKVVEKPKEEGGKKDFRQIEKSDLEEGELSDSDDSIVLIGEFPKSIKPDETMTQLETKMAETFWSKAPSSSLLTNPTINSTTFAPARLMIPSNISDGFSKDCIFSNRQIRQWNKIKLKHSILSSSPTPSSEFTVCSYNVLCQKTIARTAYLYRHLDQCQGFLEWTNRWKGLQEEIPTFNADILGLQEVQADHYLLHFAPFMKQHGYEGIYKQKFGTEVKDDGCALFYRPGKFEFVKYQEVNYFVSKSAISNRENIAQILALRCRVTKEVVLVANTHLLFNEERGDVKLAQLAILFASIQQMRDNLGKQSDFNCSIPPVIIMGDFNMEAHSLVYDFVVKGCVLVEGQFVRRMSGQSVRTGGKKCDFRELLFQTTVGTNSSFESGTSEPLLDGCMRHPFKLESVYHHDLATVTPFRTRCISTYHKDAAAPDFIFYTKDRTKEDIQKLQVLERFGLPTADTLIGATPWPNRHVPSDHLPILAKFKLTKDVL
ncbi:hypothetical protein L5515_007249 [Caenorhabditis briggsae]|uniref:Endonuclease/exonuclease/phosphatase domain-containing protein n=1 Tax=Caenorhabditis briggsae TaxID=6238 RepID=A0AAE9F2G1_CAEBR|nr:hypothetical protein L5515_007249 [Caenorhabditis briggsae]